METTAVLLLKKEPVSPLSINCDEASTDYLLYENDTIFYQSDNESGSATPPSEGVVLEDYDIKLESAEFDDILACESKAQVASQILENLENLMDLDDLIKEEPFLLDEKMLPILEEVPPAVRALSNNGNSIKMDQYHLLKSPDTFSLMKEFQSVYDIVEYQHGALTPPQSPPSQPMFTTLEPINAPSVNYNQQQMIPDGSIKQPVYSPINLVPDKQQLIMPSGLDFRQSLDYQQVATPQPADIAHELAVVDELVRTRVEDMTSWTESGPSSPNSSSSCASSNFGDSSVSDDPEWMPEMIESATDNLLVAKTAKKSSRSKPYSRSSPEDKKSRKKEQNKNAATRYRLKKKAEVEEILTEEKGLLDKNTELGNQITDLQREIKYLKGLMRDLFKAKGLIN